MPIIRVSCSDQISRCRTRLFALAGSFDTGTPMAAELSLDCSVDIDFGDHPFDLDNIKRVPGITSAVIHTPYVPLRPPTPEIFEEALNQLEEVSPLPQVMLP